MSKTIHRRVPGLAANRSFQVLYTQGVVLTNKLIVGCGYLGQRVAELWLQQGACVRAVTRSAARAEALRERGIEPIIADIMQLEALKLPASDTVLFAVGFDRTVGQSIEQLFPTGLANVLNALPSPPRRFIYISSTGVYGDAQGDWVDEETPCHPIRPGGKAALEAEQQLAQHALGDRAIVLRLAGLYGPGRIPRVAALKAGEPIDAPAEGYLNLIHVDDAARVVLAAEARAAPPATYVVADGRPPQRSEYYAELARLVGAAPPRFVSPASATPASQRAAADKRIRPQRMFDELGVKLIYPTFREGLAAIVRADASLKADRS